MSYPKDVAEVHVWRDEYDATGNPSAEYYSVSTVDDEGNEIACLGGSKSLSRAWEIGVELAEDLGVPCVEYAGPASCQGPETDRWEPIPTRGAK